MGLFHGILWEPGLHLVSIGARLRFLRSWQKREVEGYEVDLTMFPLHTITRTGSRCGERFCLRSARLEIVHAECAKCRRECDLSGVRATLCGDRACRVREMQALATF